MHLWCQMVACAAFRGHKTARWMSRGSGLGDGEERFKTALFQLQVYRVPFVIHLPYNSLAIHYS